MATWQTPKTDWTATDRFNIGDFNRIKNNLAIIYDMARTVLNKAYTIEDMGDDMTSYSSGWEVARFNAIESNLEKINVNSYNLDIGATQTFYANGVFINARELNRIESATLTYYDRLKGIYDEMPRLAFTLGAYRELKI